jgi:hypothetical protein
MKTKPLLVASVAVLVSMILAFFVPVIRFKLCPALVIYIRPALR